MEIMDSVRVECIGEVAAKLLEACSEVMAKHGDDPSNYKIIASGFAMAAARINQAHPEFMPTFTASLPVANQLYALMRKGK